MHECAMCKKEMPYGGCGICSNCLIIVQDLETIHKIAFKWSNDGYGSIEECIKYIKHDLDLFKIKCKEEYGG